MELTSATLLGSLRVAPLPLELEHRAVLNKHGT